MSKILECEVKLDSFSVPPVAQEVMQEEERMTTNKTKSSA